MASFLSPAVDLKHLAPWLSIFQGSGKYGLLDFRALFMMEGGTVHRLLPEHIIALAVTEHCAMRRQGKASPPHKTSNLQLAKLFSVILLQQIWHCSWSMSQSAS